MPSNKQALNPSNVLIEFDESEHRYSSVIDGITIEYTSVTTFVKEFFPEFDAKSAAERKAKRIGVTTQELLSEWEEKRNYASKVGTRVHEVAEDVVLGRPIRNKPEDERERLLMRQTYIAASKVRADMKIFGAEKILFDPRLALAGTADLLAFDKRGILWVLDWKQNAKIDKSSKFGVNGLFPIQHVEDCNMMHYALQLSTYEYLLHKCGYVPKTTPIRRALIHLREDGYETIPVPSMAVEVRDMIIATNLDNVPF